MAISMLNNETTCFIATATSSLAGQHVMDAVQLPGRHEQSPTLVTVKTQVKRRTRVDCMRLAKRGKQEVTINELMTASASKSIRVASQLDDEPRNLTFWCRAVVLANENKTTIEIIIIIIIATTEPKSARQRQTYYDKQATKEQHLVPSSQ